MGAVDVMPGVFCGVDGDVKPRVGTPHNIFPPACMTWHLELPPPLVVGAGVD